MVRAEAIGAAAFAGAVALSYARRAAPATLCGVLLGEDDDVSSFAAVAARHERTIGNPSRDCAAVIAARWIVAARGPFRRVIESNADTAIAAALLARLDAAVLVLRRVHAELGNGLGPAPAALVERLWDGVRVTAHTLDGAEGELAARLTREAAVLSDPPWWAVPGLAVRDGVASVLHAVAGAAGDVLAPVLPFAVAAGVIWYTRR